MLGHGRAKMGDVVVAHLEPGASEPLDCLAEEVGVEGRHAVHDQGEAQRLGGLIDELAVADMAVVGEQDGVPHALEVLPLVELAPDPLSELGALQVAQDEQGLDEPAVFLDRSGEGILAGERLELGEQQRRQHGPLVDGGTESEQGIPVVDDPAGVRPVAEQPFYPSGQCGGVEVPQALVGKVSDARREHQADQVVGAEEEVGEAVGVGGVLGDGQLAVPVAEGEDLVESEQALSDARDHLCPERGVVVGHRGQHRQAPPETEVARQRTGVEGLDRHWEPLTVR